MKLLLTMAVAIFVLAACNNPGDKDAAGTAGAEKTGTPTIDYPYTPAMPFRNWQIGSEENTVVAMKTLKSWQDSDFAGIAANVADSLDLRLDGFSAKLTRDSAVNFLKAARENYKEVTITMYDWVSVISADKKAEYVTMWYKQAWTDNKGVKDSLNVIDDCKMSNGKMIELDEKVQRFPAAKK